MKKKKRKGELWKNTVKYRQLVWMALPALLYFAIFSYVPMYGVILAFKRYNFADGIWGSPWNGLANFEFFYKSGKMVTLTGHTFFYNIIFIVVNTIANVSLAVFLSETVMAARVRKILQSMSLLPYFISWVICSIIFYNLFNYDYGVINNLITSLGGEAIHVYGSPNGWPYILTAANLWKDIGYGSIVYLAACKGIDPNLYEAAAIDGAGIWKRIRFVTIPMLKPTVVTMTLLSLGRIMRGNFEMFYQLVGQNTRIIQKTDIIDTYVFRAVLDGTDYGLTAAVGLYQSLICCVMIMAVNKLIKMYDPDYALF
ncbi:MAG: sugar ABC transporter permease [Lachnospiraceae bacterium]|nr:sugar ABC transporter permease [Lachnospiraceae bacterium]